MPFWRTYKDESESISFPAKGFSRSEPSGALPSSRPSVAILGAGDRGSIYAGFLSSGARICAIADTDSQRCHHLSHRLSDNHKPLLYGRWQDLLEAVRRKTIQMDAVVVALPDKEHLEPALAFSRLGISVLLEKPVGLNISQLDRMEKHVRSMRKKGNSAAIVVCHVLRYSDFFGKIKSIIQEGIIGEVRSIFHAENVSYYHFAHSYVRGNWKSSRDSSPVLLAKCSHDFDLLGWFADSEFRSIHCSGQASTFLPHNAPSGATERCTDGCPHQSSCLFDAESNYIHGIPLKRELWRSAGPFLSWLARVSLMWPALIYRLPFAGSLRPWPFWPTTAIVSGKPDMDSVRRALETGPYGKCVYFCGSDQPDHADTVIHFKNGITAVLRMNGNSFQEARTIRIDGSLGTLEGRFGQGGDLKVQLHRKGMQKRIPVKVDAAGHLAEDRALSEYFLKLINQLRIGPNKAGSDQAEEAGFSGALAAADRDLHQVLEGHRMALLAEKSRTGAHTIFR